MLSETRVPTFVHRPFKLSRLEPDGYPYKGVLSTLGLDLTKYARVHLGKIGTLGIIVGFQAHLDAAAICYIGRWIFSSEERRR